MRTGEERIFIRDGVITSDKHGPTTCFHAQHGIRPTVGNHGAPHMCGPRASLPSTLEISRSARDSRRVADLPATNRRPTPSKSNPRTDSTTRFRQRRAVPGKVSPSDSVGASRKLLSPPPLPGYIYRPRDLLCTLRSGFLLFRVRRLVFLPRLVAFAFCFFIAFFISFLFLCQYRVSISD